MIPRARLDIGWRDLAFAARRCVWPLGWQPPHERPQSWSAHAERHVFLSVRTGFDLLLQALALPAGSEVLLSAVTVSDMERIVREHGLVPVPLDIEADTLRIDPQSLARALSPRARAIVLAHLFGARVDFEDAIRVARAHGLLVIEDCAQSYAAPEWRGHQESDVRMFSFGPIKTQSAMGGAVLILQSADLVTRMRALHQRYPMQTRRQYARRVAKYALLRLADTAWIYGAFVAGCRLVGRSHDSVINALTRSFPGPDLLGQIRQRPCAALVDVLDRRLARPDRDRLRRRILAADTVIRRLAGHIRRPGARIQDHTHWIFPILLAEPIAMMRHLWSEGFDATRGTSSLSVIEAPPGRPELAPTRARRLMDEILFLPVYPEMPRGELERLAEVVNRFATDRKEQARTPAVALRS